MNCFNLNWNGLGITGVFKTSESPTSGFAMLVGVRRHKAVSKTGCASICVCSPFIYSQEGVRLAFRHILKSCVCVIERLRQRQAGIRYTSKHHHDHLTATQGLHLSQKQLCYIYLPTLGFKLHLHSFPCLSLCVVQRHSLKA